RIDKKQLAILTPEWSPFISRNPRVTSFIVKSKVSHVTVTAIIVKLLPEVHKSVVAEIIPIDLRLNRFREFKISLENGAKLYKALLFNQFNRDISKPTTWGSTLHSIYDLFKKITSSRLFKKKNMIGSK
ncbi:Uncharacterized protein APZ42_014745, partial [Daphnia magna]